MGSTIATGGAIRTSRKRLASERIRADGERAMAYAAGAPRAIERAVEPRAMIDEFRRKARTLKSRHVAPKLSNVSENSHFGGALKTSMGGFNEVCTSQNRGNRKKASAIRIAPDRAAATIRGSRIGSLGDDRSRPPTLAADEPDVAD